MPSLKQHINSCQYSPSDLYRAERITAFLHPQRPYGRSGFQHLFLSYLHYYSHLISADPSQPSVYLYRIKTPLSGSLFHPYSILTEESGDDILAGSTGIFHISEAEDLSGIESILIALQSLQSVIPAIRIVFRTDMRAVIGLLFV